MKLQSLLSSVLLMTLTVFYGSFATAADLCKEIAETPEIEAYFAKHRTTDLSVEEGHFVVEDSKGMGSCKDKDVIRKIEGKDDQGYGLECTYNGCGFGSGVSVLKWKGDIYFLSETKDSHYLDQLSGWEKLSIQDQQRIRFRNITGELYKVVSGTTRAQSMCEDYDLYGKHAIQEKLVEGIKYCPFYLNNGQNKSIFPVSIRDQEKWKHLELKLDRKAGYSADFNQKVTVDLNNDGRMETIIPFGGSSGAGCGYDIKSVLLLDDHDNPLVPDDDFSSEFYRITTSLENGDSFDIVADGGTYYLEKKTKVGTRELFAMSDLSKPICSFVNDAPLMWYPVEH